MRVFEEELPRQYGGLERVKKAETSETERVYSTRQGRRAAVDGWEQRLGE